MHRNERYTLFIFFFSIIEHFIKRTKRCITPSIRLLLLGLRPNTHSALAICPSEIVVFQSGKLCTPIKERNLAPAPFRRFPEPDTYIFHYELFEFHVESNAIIRSYSDSVIVTVHDQGTVYAAENDAQEIFFASTIDNRFFRHRSSLIGIYDRPMTNINERTGTTITANDSIE